MIQILLISLIATSPGEAALAKMADRYAAAPAIQWSMESKVYSPVFEETETTPVEFIFNSPDTFYFKSNQEEVLGIADTIWVMSKRHKQIQKKISSAYVMPSDLIIGWSDRYDLDDYTTKEDLNLFILTGKEGVSPADVRLTTKRNNHLNSIFYKDSVGNDVTLTVKSEKLVRSQNINLFYKNIPKGFKLIDLTD
jgi:outer membrane lipoprotein-sorting protein